MKTQQSNSTNELIGRLASFTRRCIFSILSKGPIPTHLSFIMDGNRRFAKKEHLEIGAGHKVGFTALMLILKCCYELGIKFVSVYAFSIENFNRKPEEVQILMDLMLDRIQGLLMEESIVDQYSIRVYFVGNLKLLNEQIRLAAEKVMRTSAMNTKSVLIINIAYTSTDEITHSVQESCKEKLNRIEPGKSCQVSNGVIRAAEFIEQDSTNAIRCISGDKWATSNGNREIPDEENCVTKVIDIEKHMYMAVFPDPDVIIRTSGETRLSNFLTWQATNCALYSPQALWPEIGLWHLVWAVLNFQRNYSYLEKKRKQL